MAFNDGEKGCGVMVRAKEGMFAKFGYYRHERRYPVGYQHPRAGEPFELLDAKDFSELWMERLTPEETVQATQKRRPGRPRKGEGKSTGDQEVI